MEQYHAREFAQLSKQDLFTRYPNQDPIISLVFDDETVECRWREATLSTYCWGLQMAYPKLPLSSRYLIRLPITKSSVPKMWEKILEDMQYTLEEMDVRESAISDIIMNEINKLYNDSIRYLTRYITSPTARELREIIHHPEMEEIFANLKPSHGSLKRAHKAALELVKTHPDFKDNSMARELRYGLSSPDQFLHVVLARGFTTDIDNHQFKEPVLTGYGRGIHNALWSAQESRDASIAILQSKDPVQTSDYLNRRLQLMTMMIRKVFPGDCGSRETIPWYVEPGGLSSIIGSYRYDEETDNYKVITRQDTHLIGQTVQLRNATTCHKLHEYGVCETCLGRISRQIPDTFGIGHIAVIGALAPFVQASLSAKHLIISKEAVTLVLDTETAKYLKFPRKDDQNSLVIQPKVLQKGVTTELIFKMNDLVFINDMLNGICEQDLQISSASFISYCQISLTNAKGDNIREPLTVSDIGRQSHLTREFLEYILENPEERTTINQNTVKINLKDWNHRDPIFTIPLRITGVKDFMDKFEKTILNGKSAHRIDGSTPSGIADMMRQCYNIVKECVDIPVSHLGVIISALLIRDSDALDYRLPLPGGKRELSSLAKVYAFRSLSQTMAYENRANYLSSSATMLIPIRSNHPMDALFAPEESDIYEDVRKARELGTIDPEILPEGDKIYRKPNGEIVS